MAASIALLPVGCGGQDSSSPGRGRASGERTHPALCTRLHARVTGRVSTSAATELSGLVMSHSHAGVLWTHNDSGDSPRVLALAPDGRLLGDVAVTGAANFDWEDIAIGREPDGRDALYLGDIGDNAAARSAVVVYRVPEPPLVGGAPSSTEPAERFTLRYPDRAHDAEALMVDPSSGAVVIVTKSLGASARVYLADHPSTVATTTMRRVGRVSLGNALEVTAGDISADGRTIVVRTYDRALVWSRRGGESVAAALRRRPCTAGADLLVERQGEALGLTRNGRAFYTVPEGEHPALRRWAPAR